MKPSNKAKCSIEMIRFDYHHPVNIVGLSPDPIYENETEKEYLKRYNEMQQYFVTEFDPITEINLRAVCVAKHMFSFGVNKLKIEIINYLNKQLIPFEDDLPLTKDEAFEILDLA